MVSGVDVVIVVADVTAANVVVTCVEVVDVVVEVRSWCGSHMC